MKAVLGVLVAGCSKYSSGDHQSVHRSVLRWRGVLDVAWRCAKQVKQVVLSRWCDANRDSRVGARAGGRQVFSRWSRLGVSLRIHAQIPSRHSVEGPFMGHMSGKDGVP